MATASSPPVDQAANLETDIGAIWKMAIDQYEKTTTKKIDSLAGACSIDEILSEIHDKETKFKAFRHDESKLDKFRTIVKKSLAPIIALSGIVGTATSTVYPPSEAIFGAVRYLIQITNSVSADYDKLTAFFEELGSYLHRLKILEHDLPPFHELKMALAEVLTSVLVLCGISTKYSKKNRIVKAFRNLTGEDEELSTAYTQFHKMVERERVIVEHAIVVGVEQLKKNTSALHADVTTGLAVAERIDKTTEISAANSAHILSHLENQEGAAEREKLLKWLSPLDFNEKLRAGLDRHQKGTGQWLLVTNTFQQWFQNENNTTLWCPGNPGVGKTVMLSLAIKYVEEHTEKTKACIACVYCDYKDVRTQSVVQLISSITRQLAEQCTPIPPEVKAFREKYVDKRIQPTTEDWIPLIECISSLFEQTYIFVDALDECFEATRDEFLMLASTLESSVRFLITTRPHVLLEDRFAYLSRLDIIAQDYDLQTYLESEMGKSRRMSKYLKREPGLKGEILKKVKEKAAGMFLLAHLHIIHLCGQTSIKNVRKALDALPTGIYAFYDDAMARIEAQDEEDVQLAKKALSYLYCARRPLRWKELCEALAIESGDTELDDAALPDEEIVLNTSAGLIRKDGQSSSTGFVHYTLQEYLAKHPEKLLPEPETELAKVCLTYLSFDAFQAGPCEDANDLEKRLDDFAFLDYAAHSWGYHVKSNQEMGLLMELLDDGNKLSSSIQVLHIPRFRMKGWQHRFPTSFGPIHVSAFWGLDKTLATYYEAVEDINARDSQGATALHLAAQHGHLATVKCLVEIGADVDVVNSRGATALSVAARNGHTAVVEFLFTKGIAATIQDDEGWTAFDWAVMSGFNGILRILLSHTLETDAGRGYLNQSLVLASEAGNGEGVRLLLDNGADSDWISERGISALTMAVIGGHEEIVRLFLENGANVNIANVYGYRPLHSAMQHESITRLLLEKGAEVNAKSDSRRTILHLCAKDGQVEVLKILLEHGADVNAQDKEGITALQAAALKGHEAMVHLLLEYHADPNKKDKDDWTSLHAAAIGGHDGSVSLLLPKVENGLQIVADITSQMKDVRTRARLSCEVIHKLEGGGALTGLRAATQRVQKLLALLEAGADIDARDDSGYTALTVACALNAEEGVQLLLENGADANKAAANGLMPLYFAAEAGNGKIVKMLIEYGADVNADHYFWTPLLLAASQGHRREVEYLVEHGADVNAQNFDSRTALHWLSKTGDAKTAQLLIDRGADVNILNRWGESPLELAIESGNTEIEKVLRRSGADIKDKA